MEKNIFNARGYVPEEMKEALQRDGVRNAVLWLNVETERHGYNRDPHRPYEIIFANERRNIRLATEQEVVAWLKILSPSVSPLLDEYL